ncbi:MAG: secondary thiamine-phosphate synthase enzyme YjbQ [Candidatus Hodarchaeales archaeon]|jgi:secondary thiamine-phosphate synthase enzyme
MTVYQSVLTLKQTYEGDIIDITSEISQIVSKSSIKEGLISIFNAGSTGAIITLEYEPGLIKDIPDFLEKIIPKNRNYYHEQTWHDGNGHSHVRASLLGPSLTVPIINNSVIHGTWQQIAFIELDVKPRRRKLYITCVGDSV